jgi:hypothetical protein
MGRVRLLPLLLVGAALGAACGAGPGRAAPSAVASSSSVAPSSAVAPATTVPTTEAPTTTLPPGVRRPPAWLGTRALPRRADGFAEVLPTPPELVDRRFATEDHFPPPPDGTFTSSVRSLSTALADRAGWSAACPVALEDLREVRVAFVGFDARAHTGQLVVHREVADAVVSVFHRLFDARFPIEEMRVIHVDPNAPPTGDGNDTAAFACRPSRGATSWSEHAYGRAIDVNPFQNPEVKGDLVLPELASAYADRTDVRPGMILRGDVVTRAFAEIGWKWGGDFTSFTDPMHFSANGR